MKLNNKGFAVVEALLIVVIVVIVGFVGYKVWSIRSSNKVQPSTASISTIAPEPDNTPEIKSTQDLSSASTELDTLNIDSEAAEVNQLEKEVNAL